MTRRVTLQIFVLVSLVAAIGYAIDFTNGYAQQIPVADRSGATPNELDGGGGLRLREGMKLVNQVGELKNQRGRIVFSPEGETYSLELLENLALQRVSRDLDQPNRMWSVSGVVTEYNGDNYLLLQRAVLKARPSNSPGPRF